MGGTGSTQCSRQDDEAAIALGWLRGEAKNGGREA
jgi:hypothetical protein